MDHIVHDNVTMTSTSNEHSVVATYDSHTGAQGAITALQKAGIDMKRLSIIGKGFHTEEHAMGFYTTGDRIKHWAGNGAFLGSLWGMLFGTAFFFLPAIGPVVVMGPMVAWIVGVLEGAAVGGSVGVFAGALTSIGIPKDSIVKYELEVKAGKFLVLARGTADMVEQARGVLGSTGASRLIAHAA
ncbi:MAG: hypothetical protein RJA70_1426 [Pseudomonadota bacterium]|jgi:uncharacterized membrane protein